MIAQNFSRALGNIEEKYIDEAATYVARLKPISIWLKWGAAAACFALIIVTLLITMPILDDSVDGWVTEDTLPTDIENIIWDEYIGVSGNTAVENYEYCNGFRIHPALYNALEISPEGKYIAIIIGKANGESIGIAECSDILGDTISRQYKNDNLYLFLTKEQFKNLPIKNKSDYIFSLADLNKYQS